MSWPSDPGIPGYAMVMPLGINGAEVYLAVRSATGAQVVLKLWSGGASDHQRREAATARLRHPNILAVLEVGETSGGPFSVFESLPRAVPLSVKLQRGEVRATDAARVVEAVARAAEHARGRGMRLCDIRPSDVVLADADVVKVLPVFVEDESPSTSLRDDLHRIGMLIAAMVEGQASAGPWNALRTTGTRCVGGGSESSPASFAPLMEMLAEIASSLVCLSARVAGGSSGPTALER